jgi:hypothetical protein
MAAPSPSVPDFIAGYGPQQSDMYSLWTGPATFFQNRMALRVSQTSGTTTLPSSGALTTIQFDTVLEDPYGGWSATHHWWTPPAGLYGWFQVTLTVWAVPTALNVVLELGTLLSNVIPSLALCDIVANNGVSGATGTYWVYMSGGQDNVAGQARVLNASANVPTNLTAGENSTMEIMWLAT